MKSAFTLQIAAAAIAISSAAFGTEVAVCTDNGRFVIELADAQSPKHVENFLRYVDMSYYAGKVFHRVMPGFVVQGGGLDRQLRARPTLPPVPNESSNGLSNVRGSVSAARTTDPNSATSQFFVNLEDNTALDAGANPGYTVFGRVKEGIQVVDAISRLPTGRLGTAQGRRADAARGDQVDLEARRGRTRGAARGRARSGDQAADRRARDRAELRGGAALDRSLPRAVRHRRSRDLRDGSTGRARDERPAACRVRARGVLRHDAARRPLLRRRGGALRQRGARESAERRTARRRLRGSGGSRRFPTAPRQRWSRWSRARAK